ncbi:MAG TPA: condensation domain-containing protein, partial [Candidatus Baltobacteraceae bacterium]|nr:condensation domain-containing protein [Candidatus Baltobacteraceae bacterium]
MTLRLRGPLDEALFQNAWNQILTRHDALRASFGATGERMRIAPATPFAFTRADFSADAVADRTANLGKLIDSEARTPFDLGNGPLVRGHLVRLAPDEHAFVFTAHHIVCDGWSMNVILAELAQIYESARRNETLALAEPLGFTFYAGRQARRDATSHAKTESYWLEQFAELPPLLELPTDRPRPAVKSYRGATSTARIERDAYLALKKIGARHGCTLFTTLLAAYEVLVGRLSDQNDIVVGVPAAGQALLEDEILVGHCVDFLPLRARWNKETTLAELLRDVKQRVLDAYEHQQYTLATLVRNLAPAREANRTPIAEIQFNLERLADDLPFASLEASVEPNPKAFVNFDLFLNVVESSDGLRLDCDYNSDLFEAATIERWLGYYRRVLDEIGRDSAQALTRVDYMSDADRDLLARLNATAAAYPPELTVHELFDAAAARHGSRCAVRFGTEMLTYADLETRANGAANHLLSRIGGPGQRVAVCIRRCPELLVALLATLKAGCSYVPLDPTHPAARLQQIVADAGVTALVTDGSFDRRLIPAGVALVNSGDLSRALDPSATRPLPDVRPDSVAYVIYTSGSTGTPKGVAVSHRSIVNLLASFERSLRLDENAELLAVTTVSFDIAGLELFLPLSAGATVSIASDDELSDPLGLVECLRLRRVNMMQATPALWTVLLEAGFNSHPGLTMLCGGEALPPALARRLLAG